MKTHTTDSTAQHTPGPWRANRTTVETDINGEIWTIAGTRNDKQGEANARLIAAAPELLEALKDATEMLALMGIPMREHEHTRAMLAAIARATGQA